MILHAARTLGPFTVTLGLPELPTLIASAGVDYANQGIMSLEWKRPTGPQEARLYLRSFGREGTEAQAARWRYDSGLEEPMIDHLVVLIQLRAALPQELRGSINLVVGVKPENAPNMCYVRWDFKDRPNGEIWLIDSTPEEHLGGKWGENTWFLGVTSNNM